MWRAFFLITIGTDLSPLILEFVAKKKKDLLHVVPFAYLMSNGLEKTLFEAGFYR